MIRMRVWILQKRDASEHARDQDMGTDVLETMQTSMVVIRIQAGMFWEWDTVKHGLNQDVGRNTVEAVEHGVKAGCNT